MKQYFVYILASKRNGTLYTGITNNIVRRIWEHQSKYNKGFSSKYGVDMLVYYKSYDRPGEAIRREKQIKKWKRDWKIRLIEEENPYWRDLYDGLEDLG